METVEDLSANGQLAFAFVVELGLFHRQLSDDAEKNPRGGMTRRVGVAELHSKSTLSIQGGSDERLARD